MIDTIADFLAESKDVLLVLLGSVLAVLTQWAAIYFTDARQRRLTAYRKLLDKADELEETAGFLAERLSGRGKIEHDDPQLIAAIQKMRLQAGRFHRYPALANAIRDFNNAVDITFSDAGNPARKDERDNEVGRLEQFFKTLVAEADKITQAA